MAEYEKKVRQILRDHGCHFVRRGKGDHDIWQGERIKKGVKKG
jgi:hypothetical protein